MKKRSLILGLVIMSAMFMSTQKSYADLSDSESYTVTIPSVAAVVLTTGGSTTITPPSSSWGTGRTTATSDSNANFLTLGNGDHATSTSYVITNDTTLAGGKQYQITAAGTNGDTAVIADASGKAKLTVTDSVNTTTAVDLFMTKSSAATYPTLGDGSPVAFAVSSGVLNIAASSSVPFNATDNIAPLDLNLDLDEASLNYVTDKPSTLTFDLTLTAVGLN